MSKTTQRKAVIVGAGIAGLAAARRLSEIGWEVVVAEKAPERRGGGYLLALTGLGYQSADRMGLLAALSARALNPVEFRYANAAGRFGYCVPGDTMRAVLGQDAVILFRGDIESVLYDAIPGNVDLQFGQTVDEITQDDTGVQVTLASGGTLTADLLIAADGLHSATRRQVFGPEKGFRRDLGHMLSPPPRSTSHPTAYPTAP
ncbi:FAD-dependent monooxygenase [Fodinicola feengrottensis]|uniref:FAD-dependent monooxygenase n=1 Tax=Fodinicola feengrottensis TaxID=435914 RepID=UPI002443116A|nr:FAD-dependent monooxygenase [Fodinicola feengrottensis]